MHAVKHKSSAVIGLLAKSRANMRVRKSPNSETLLMLAIRGGDMQTIMVLVRLGVCINAIDKTGRTALMLALTEPFSSNLQFVRYLLSRGAETH